jgi:hypothetical protein
MTAIFASARFMSKPCTPFALLRIVGHCQSKIG